MLEAIEKYEKVNAHFDLGSVSMTRRFSGVAEAEDKNENVA
jgi:hypothetical protein